MKYEHTQPGWPLRFSLGIAAAGLLAAAAITPNELLPVARAILIGAALLSALLGWMWGALTIRVGDGVLRWQFGLGWPRKSVPLADIASVEMTRTTFWNGWGVHRTRRGWLYNIAGKDAVLIRKLDGKTFLLGTDEPRKLKAALERAAGQAKRTG
jgi:hypothetical protein